MDEAFITIDTEETVFDWRQMESEGMRIRKFLHQPDTVFDFHFLNYTQFGGVGNVNEDCGSILYNWTFFDDLEANLLYLDENDHF